ncbi:endonuclease, partial [Bacteroides acidifaciens]
MKLKIFLFFVFFVIVFCGCQSNYQPTSITVASYNLRNATGSDSVNGNGWGQRYPVIAQMVQYHD